MGAMPDSIVVGAIELFTGDFNSVQHALRHIPAISSESLLQSQQTLQHLHPGHWGLLQHQYWWLTKHKELGGSDPQWPEVNTQPSNLSVSSSLTSCSVRQDRTGQDSTSAGTNCLFLGPSWIVFHFIMHQNVLGGQEVRGQLQVSLLAEPLKLSLKVEIKAWKMLFGKHLNLKYKALMEGIVAFEAQHRKRLDRPIKDLEDLRQAMAALEAIRQKQIEADMCLGPIEVCTHIHAGSRADFPWQYHVCDNTACMQTLSQLRDLACMQTFDKCSKVWTKWH